ncbi:hypothetical protein [Methylobacterium sp. Leaf89]|uniref:hypothetical protein n=1 Tax=Methylobacterium sp. Leaf89 TaxID=1736245 RepID=UPI0006FDAE02|nr:hypothetical protein [Methylobacterium sp. Leaf89]KQO68278.1 hypothetical protein ASF18_07540 [Methylobacterium sp. Leaf89]
MRQRFTVIEGGAAAEGSVVAGSVAGTSLADATERAPASPIGASVSWRVDLRRAAAVSEAEIAAWRALLVRARVADPVLSDPDHLLSVAQHQAGGRDLVFALAWATGQGPDQLAAVLPLAMPHTLWGQERIGLWQPHGTTLTPAIAPACFEPVRAAVADCLRRLRPRAVLALEPVAAPRPETAIAPLRAVPRRAGIPAHSLVGVRANPAQVERVSEPGLVRDAVEEFLLLDAEVSSAPIIGDPSEAALVRVVTRLFAQRRQATVALTRRDDAIVAATITLGHGAQAVLWRQVAGEGVPERFGRRA